MTLNSLSSGVYPRFAAQKTNASDKNPKILGLSGSTRDESLNKKLLNIAVNGAREAGAEVTMIKLEDYPLPIFENKLTPGKLPLNAKRLHHLVQSHDTLLIASPEYNGSMTAALKNFIDWVSRSHEKGKPSAFDGKLVAILSASPAINGGVEGLAHVRAVLSKLGMWVLPDKVTIGRAKDAFNVDGSLKDAVNQSQTKNLGARLAGLAGRYKASA